MPFFFRASSRHPAEDETHTHTNTREKKWKIILIGNLNSFKMYSYLHIYICISYEQLWCAWHTIVRATTKCSYKSMSCVPRSFATKLKQTTTKKKNILYMTRMFGWLMAWPHRFAWLIAVRLSHCYVAGVTKTISKNTIGKSLKWYQTTINAQCHHGRRLSSTHNTSWCPMPREERQLILRDYMHTKNEERTHRYMCVTHRCMKSPLFINVMRSLISW